MTKKITFWAFVTILIIIATWWFINTREVRTPIADGINAIPTNAVVILESKQSTATWKKLSQTNIMWEELLGTETFKKLNLQGNYLDSLIASDPSISELPEGHSLYISVHPNGNSVALLFVYSLPDLTRQSAVEDFFEKINHHHPPVYSKIQNTSLGIISTPGHDSLSFAFADGVLIMSASKKLAEDAIQQLHSGNSLAKDKNFSKIFTSAGKNVDANVYVNYQSLHLILDHFIASGSKKEVAALTDFAGYSGWDVTLKPNSLMLNGFTSVDSTASYLNLFTRQKPQPVELTKIIPSKTALMIFSGLSNATTFQNDYKNYLQLKHRLAAYSDYVNQTNKKYNVDLEKSFISWIDNEMALVVTEPSSDETNENAFAVIRSNDIGNAVSTLTRLSDVVNAGNNEHHDTIGFRGHTIYFLDLPGALPHLLGAQFNGVKNNYFTIISNYLVFGNSEDALKNFIDDFESNKTLANDKNYESFAENISTEANLYIYSSIARSSKIYTSFLSPELSSDLNGQLELLHKFEAVGIQFTYGNKLFYSTLFLKYNPEYKKESGTLWESKLDITVSAKPYLVINHNTKAKEVFVQDDANKIYLISNTGKIIWTKQLHEKIMSDVIQVDVLKNDKLQMVFNTSTSIYMFDRNGNDMKGFPVVLKSPATNAISVVDYEKNRDYRIFIACENKKILCYKCNGELVDGFKFGKTENTVYLPVQYFNVSNKDHLCAIDVKGKINILDRHGDTRIRLKEQLAPGIRNFFIETGKDYSRSFIVAADTLGNIIRISLNGDKESIRIQDFETSPYFEYRDINNDKTREFIFLTRNELKVFSQDKSLLFNYSFKTVVSQVPQFFQFPDGSGKIGVVSETTNELFLFNDNGSLYDAFPLNGKTLFSIGDLNNDGSYDLVTGSSDKSIYVYQLQ